MAVTYSITDSFIAGGVGQNGLTASAYANSRFTTPPAKNASAPSGAADGTATTGSSYGNDGSFQITGLAAGLYWVAITYSGTTYWKLYTVGGAPFGAMIYGSGAPSNSLYNVGDQYTDLTTGIVYGPKTAAVGGPQIRASAVGTTGGAGTVTIPASVQVGDLMIVTAAGVTTATPPAGWTTLSTQAAGSHQQTVSYRFAQAGDPGTTITFSDSAGFGMAVLTAIYGSSLTAPTVGSPVTVSSGTTITLPSASPPAAASMTLAAVAGGGNVNGITITWPSPSTPLAQGWESGSYFALAGLAVLGTPNQSNAMTFNFATTGAAAWPIYINQSTTQWPTEGTYTTVRFGAGAPAGGLGNVGDQYVDENTGDIYGPKIAVASAAPVFRAGAGGYTATNGPGVVVSATIPASTATGDLLLAAVGQSGTVSVTTPSGWTLLGTSGQFTYFYRFALSTDHGTTVSFTCAGNFPNVSLVAYNVNGVTTPPYLSGAVVTSPTANSGALSAQTASNDPTDVSLAAVCCTQNAFGTVGGTLTESPAGTNRELSSGSITGTGLAEIGWAGNTVTMSATGGTVNGFTAQRIGISGTSSGAWTKAGTLYNASAPATLTGTTAGTAVSSQPNAGTNYKKFVVYLNGYENTTGTAQTITFPTAFTHTPYLAHDDSGGATVSATTLTLPASMGATKTGWIVVEGF